MKPKKHIYIERERELNAKSSYTIRTTTDVHKHPTTFFSRSHATAAIFPGHLDGPVPATSPFFQTYGSIWKNWKIHKFLWFLVTGCLCLYVLVARFQPDSIDLGIWGHNNSSFVLLHLHVPPSVLSWIVPQEQEQPLDHAMDKEICFKYFKHVQLLSSGKYIA